MTALRNRSGFSLLEVVLTVAILGIALSIGGLALNEYLRQVRAREAAVVVAETFRRVGDRAILESRGIALTLAEPTLSWSSDGTPLGSETLPPGTSILSQTPPGVIDFSGRGLPVQQVVVVLQRGGIERTVVLFPTGATVIR